MLIFSENKNTNKCALVTGGAGFIGSHIVDRLLSLGWRVVVIDNESADTHDSFYWNPLAENYKLDITDYNSIKHLFKDVDYVFHLAAESRIQPSLDNPALACEVNFVGTCNVLNACKEHKVKRMMYSSSSSVYGLTNTPPYNEEMKTNCLNPYSVSKASGEELCKMYYNLWGVETVSFRYFNVYGDRQPLKGQYAPVIGLFLRQKKNNNPMTVVGDGLQTRDFTNVEDVVNANILACKTNNKDILGKIINIGTGRSFSILDLVNIIGGDYEHIPARPAEARNTVADTSKAKKLLGWEPRIKLEDYLKKQ